MPSRTIVVVVTAGALSSWGCASLRYKPTELTAAGEAVRVVERSQATPHGCKQVGFVDARNLHGDPVYMRNKLRNDSAEFGATHVHIDDFNRLYSSGTAFVCDSPQDEGAGMTSAQGLTPTDPTTPPGTPAPTPAPATQPPAPATQPPGNQAEAPVAPVAHGEPSPAKPGTGGVAPVVAPPSSPPAAAKSESASAATQPAPAPQPAPKAAAAASAQPPAASSDVDPEDVPAPPPVP